MDYGVCKMEIHLIATAAKEFLLEKFNDLVISRGTDIIWPAHSTDVNPLDFFVWTAALKKFTIRN